MKVAPWVNEMLAAGKSTFYTYAGGKKLVYDPGRKDYVVVEQGPLVMNLTDVRRTSKTLAGNEVASLFDIGDGVMLLEFHSKVNELDTPKFEIMQEAIERLHGSANGLVIANDGRNFSVGANLFA